MSLFLAFVFAAGVFLPEQGFAQSLTHSPAPVALSPAFTPLLLRGIKIYPNEPFRFNFIVQNGDQKLEKNILKQESEKLIRYFLASLTLPEDELWVNLSPYEKDRIVPDTLGSTEMGRDMLAQDYLLKQITASLTNPDSDLGKEFWSKVYQKAYEQYGTTNIPVDTFNKVWIMPSKAEVYVKEDKAFIVESKLKVMLEEDYLAAQEASKEAGGLSQSSQPAAAAGVPRKGMGAASTDEMAKDRTRTLTSQVVREVFIPALEKEVNTGKNFSQLRQIYHALILATWFKQKLKTALVNQILANRSKTKGLDLSDKAVTERIYNKYVSAFQQGIHDSLKVEYDPHTKKNVARKYFAGGVKLSWTASSTLQYTSTFSGPIPTWIGDSTFNALDLYLVATAHATTFSYHSTTTLPKRPEDDIPVADILKQYEERGPVNDSAIQRTLVPFYRKLGGSKQKNAPGNIFFYGEINSIEGIRQTLEAFPQKEVYAAESGKTYLKVKSLLETMNPDFQKRVHLIKSEPSNLKDFIADASIEAVFIDGELNAWSLFPDFKEFLSEMNRILMSDGIFVANAGLPEALNKSMEILKALGVQDVQQKRVPSEGGWVIGFRKAVSSSLDKATPSISSTIAGRYQRSEDFALIKKGSILFSDVFGVCQAVGEPERSEATIGMPTDKEAEGSKVPVLKIRVKQVPDIVPEAELSDYLDIASMGKKQEVKKKRRSKKTKKNKSEDVEDEVEEEQIDTAPEAEEKDLSARRKIQKGEFYLVMEYGGEKKISLLLPADQGIKENILVLASIHDAKNIVAEATAQAGLAKGHQIEESTGEDDVPEEESSLETAKAQGGKKRKRKEDESPIVFSDTALGRMAKKLDQKSFLVGKKIFTLKARVAGDILGIYLVTSEKSKKWETMKPVILFLSDKDGVYVGKPLFSIVSLIEDRDRYSVFKYTQGHLLDEWDVIKKEAPWKQYLDWSQYELEEPLFDLIEENAGIRVKELPEPPTGLLEHVGTEKEGLVESTADVVDQDVPEIFAEEALNPTADEEDASVDATGARDRDKVFLEAHQPKFIALINQLMIQEKQQKLDFEGLPSFVKYLKKELGPINEEATNAFLSRLFGTSKTTIGNWLVGDVDVPIHLMDKIAKRLGLDEQQTFFLWHLMRGNGVRIEDIVKEWKEKILEMSKGKGFVETEEVFSKILKEVSFSAGLASRVSGKGSRGTSGFASDVVKKKLKFVSPNTVFHWLEGGTPQGLDFERAFNMASLFTINCPELTEELAYLLLGVADYRSTPEELLQKVNDGLLTAQDVLRLARLRKGQVFLDFWNEMVAQDETLNDDLKEGGSGATWLVSMEKGQKTRAHYRRVEVMAKVIGFKDEKARLEFMEMLVQKQNFERAREELYATASQAPIDFQPIFQELLKVFGSWDNMRGLRAVELGVTEQSWGVDYLRRVGLNIDGVGNRADAHEFFMHRMAYDAYLKTLDPDSVDFIYSVKSLYPAQKRTEADIVNPQASDGWANPNAFPDIVRVLKPGGLLVNMLLANEKEYALTQEELASLGLEQVTQYEAASTYDSPYLVTVMRKAGSPTKKSISTVLELNESARNRLGQMIEKYYQGTDRQIESRLEWFSPYAHLREDILERIVRGGLTKEPFTNPSSNFLLKGPERKALWSGAQTLAENNVQDLVVTTYGGGEFLPRGSLANGGNTELEESLEAIIQSYDAQGKKTDITLVIYDYDPTSLREYPYQLRSLVDFFERKYPDWKNHIQFRCHYGDIFDGSKDDVSVWQAMATPSHITFWRHTWVGDKEYFEEPFDPKSMDTFAQTLEKAIGKGVLIVSETTEQGPLYFQKIIGGEANVKKLDPFVLALSQANASVVPKLEKLLSEDKPLTVELGFGDGEWILEKARAFPETNFLALDLYLSASRKEELDVKAPDNLVYLQADAQQVLKLFPEGSMERLVSINPEKPVLYAIHDLFSNEDAKKIFKSAHVEILIKPAMLEDIDLFSKDDAFSVEEVQLQALQATAEDLSGASYNQNDAIKNKDVAYRITLKKNTSNRGNARAISTTLIDARGQVNLQAFMYGKIPTTDAHTFLSTIYTRDGDKKVRALDFGSDGQFVQHLFDKRYASILENVYALDIRSLQKMDFGKTEMIDGEEVFAMQEIDQGFAPELVTTHAPTMKVDWIFMNGPDPDGQTEYYFKEIEALAAKNAMVFLRLHERDQGAFEEFRQGFRNIGFDFLGVIENPPEDYPPTEFISGEGKSQVIYLFTNQLLDDVVEEQGVSSILEGEENEILNPSERLSRINIKNAVAAGDIVIAEGNPVAMIDEKLSRANTRALDSEAELLFKFLLNSAREGGQFDVLESGPGFGRASVRMWRLSQEKGIEANIDTIGLQMLDPFLALNVHKDEILKAAQENNIKSDKPDMVSFREALATQKAVGKKFLEVLKKPFIRRQYVGDFTKIKMPKQKYKFIYDSFGGFFYSFARNSKDSLEKILSVLDPDEGILFLPSETMLVSDVQDILPELKDFVAITWGGGCFVLIHKDSVHAKKMRGDPRARSSSDGYRYSLDIRGSDIHSVLEVLAAPSGDLAAGKLTAPPVLTRLAQGIQKLRAESNFEKRIEIAEEVGVDTRPAKQNLLGVQFVGLGMAIKKQVNPDNKSLKAIYAGAGADISNLLYATNATEMYFLNETLVSPMALESCLDPSWWNDEDFGDELWLAEYRGHKFTMGWSRYEEIDNSTKLAMALMIEMKSIGVERQDIKVSTNQDGNLRVDFKWIYPGSTEKKDYTITFINGDVNVLLNKELTPPELARVLSGGIDIFFMKAGNILAEDYKNFMGLIGASINDGGFCITNDSSNDLKESDPQKYLEKGGSKFTDALVNPEKEQWEKLLPEIDASTGMKTKKYGNWLNVRKKLSSGRKNISSPAGEKGGIDFSAKNINLQTNGDNIELIIPLELQGIDLNSIEGLVPVIMTITPIINIFPLLGLEQADIEKLKQVRKAEPAREPEKLSLVH